MPTMTISDNSHGPGRLLTTLLAATINDLCHSYAPSHSINQVRLPKSSSSHLSARPRPSSSNWEDEFASSRNNADVTDYRPPWREHEGGGGGSSNANSNTANTNKESFQQTSTDDFKRPHGSVPPTANQQQRPPQDNTFRHAFQMSSTDDFKRPHGMPAGMDQPRAPPPRGNVFKSPFQTCTTDDFKRSSDVASGVGASQQPIYTKPSSGSDSFTWMQDSFDSMQPPPKIIYDAEIIDDEIATTYQEPVQPQHAQSQPAHAQATPQVAIPEPPPNTPEQHLEQWDKKLETAQSKSSKMLIHNIKWPLMRDPPGVSSEFPLLTTRVAVTVLATISTHYLHLYKGCSPVLASSAITLLVSTCVDRRLGQAAFCGSFAGLSGGHLVPTLSMAMVLGGLTSVCYELLIHINNLFLGIGGRLGATAFLATSILAKYQHVGSVGRKLRRGLWKSGAGPSSIVVSMVLFHMLGSVATIFLREYSDDSATADPVRASAVIGLLGSLFLEDPMAVMALFGGSFVGMSLPSRLMYGNAPGNPKTGKPQTALSLFTTFAGAGAIAGLIHAITIHYGYWNGGWGGKAGLCAFVGCWIYRGLGNLSQFTKQRAQ